MKALWICLQGTDLVHNSLARVEWTAHSPGLKDLAGTVCQRHNTNLRWVWETWQLPPTLYTEQMLISLIRLCSRLFAGIREWSSIDWAKSAYRHSYWTFRRLFDHSLPLPLAHPFLAINMRRRHRYSLASYLRLFLQRLSLAQKGLDTRLAHAHFLVLETD